MKRNLTALLVALGAVIFGQPAMADGFDAMQKKFTEKPVLVIVYFRSLIKKWKKNMGFCIYVNC